MNREALLKIYPSLVYLRLRLTKHFHISLQADLEKAAEDTFGLRILLTSHELSHTNSSSFFVTCPHFFGMGRGLVLMSGDV